MKRILAFVLVVLIMVGTLWGCQKSESQTTLVPGLSDERAYEIQTAFYHYWEDYIAHYYPESVSRKPHWTPWIYQGYNYGIFYLCSADGYDFVYSEEEGYEINIETGESVIPTLWIGETDFYGASNGALWAYKEGTIYKLKDLYDDGIIGEETIRLIKGKYEVCYEEWKSIPATDINAGMDRWYFEGKTYEYVPGGE